MRAMQSSAPRAAPRQGSQTLKLGARKTLFDEGEPAKDIYEIISGVIITYKLISDGRRQILDLLRPGDFVGFTLGAFHGHGAQTLTTCELRRSSRQSLFSTGSDQSRLMSYLVGHRDQHYDRAVVLARSSAAGRLAAFFCEFGGTGAAGEDVQLSLRELSDYLGLRPETLSRQLAKLSKAKLIVRSKWGTYRVSDLDRLAKIASLSQSVPSSAMLAANGSDLDAEHSSRGG